MRIASADDAKGVVRKYFIGTRSRHGKIASITVEEEVKGPDSKGMWTVKGAFVTTEGEKEEFDVTVTSRGEVMIASGESQESNAKLSTKQPTRSRR